MKARTLLVAVLVVFAVSMSAFAQAPPPGRTCNVQSAVGAYGYSCSGVAPNPFNNFAIEPFAAYGYVYGNNLGQWNGYGKVSFNGSIHRWTHNTTRDAPAVIRPDCTGAVTYKATVDGSWIPDSHIEFVVVNQGREIKGMVIDEDMW